MEGSASLRWEGEEDFSFCKEERGRVEAKTKKRFCGLAFEEGRREKGRANIVIRGVRENPKGSYSC